MVPTAPTYQRNSIEIRWSPSESCLFNSGRFTLFHFIVPKHTHFNVLLQKLIHDSIFPPLSFHQCSLQDQFLSIRIFNEDIVRDLCQWDPMRIFHHISWYFRAFNVGCWRFWACCFIARCCAASHSCREAASTWQRLRRDHGSKAVPSAALRLWYDRMSYDHVKI